jgi:hypothetical protein
MVISGPRRRRISRQTSQEFFISTIDRYRLRRDERGVITREKSDYGCNLVRMGYPAKHGARAHGF